MTKKSFEILKNIELICFLLNAYIKTYINFLENNLKNENEQLLFK